MTAISDSVTRHSRFITLLRRFYGRDRRGAIVLAYHSVGDPARDHTGQAVSPRTFEAQLQALQRRATIVPAASLVRSVAAGESLKGLAAVTFDDGYADTLQVAWPIASRLGVPLTVFVTTQPLLTGEPFWWDILAVMVFGADAVGGRGRVAEVPFDGDRLPLRTDIDRRQTFDTLHRRLRNRPGRARADAMRRLASILATPGAPAGRPMTVAELRTLAAGPTVTIGAHSDTHPSLAALSPAAQLRELTESRRTLESLVQRPVDLVAYPFGKPENVSRETRDAARHAGYLAAFTTFPTTVNPSSDLMALPRLTAHEWSETEFVRRLDALTLSL